MHSAMTASPSLAAHLVRGWQRHKWSYFFIAPSMILFFIFIAYPVLQAFLFASQKVDLRGSSWIGLKNFTDLANSKLFWATMQPSINGNPAIWSAVGFSGHGKTVYLAALPPAMNKNAIAVLGNFGKHREIVRQFSGAIQQSCYNAGIMSQ